MHELFSIPRPQGRSYQIAGLRVTLRSQGAPNVRGIIFPKLSTDGLSPMSLIAFSRLVEHARANRKFDLENLSKAASEELVGRELLVIPSAELQKVRNQNMRCSTAHESNMIGSKNARRAGTPGSLMEAVRRRIAAQPAAPQQETCTIPAAARSGSLQNAVRRRIQQTPTQESAA